MTTITETKSNPELLTSKQVARMLSVSVRTLWRLVAAKQVPEPIRYNRKLVRWKSTELAHYFKSL